MQTRSIAQVLVQCLVCTSILNCAVISDSFAFSRYTPEHQKYLSYNADKLSRWAMSAGSIITEKAAGHFLKSGKIAEQGYKACVALTKLEQRYGKLRLEASCSKALAYSTTPSLASLPVF